MTTHTDSLTISDLRVQFGDFVAVDGVDFSVGPGDVRFLIGPNGAGKTTFIDAVTGLAPAKGSVTFRGEELTSRKTHEIARLGIGRTFQSASVFESLTVLQNLDIAAGATRGVTTLLRGRPAVPDAIAEALETIGLSDHADRIAGALSHGQKQWLEIGMLLVQDAGVMLLDEPVAGMSQAERVTTGELLHSIGRDRIVVVVEHDMEFLRDFAQSVTVMAAGEIVAEGSVQEVQSSTLVQELYLGPGAAADDHELVTAQAVS